MAPRNRATSFGNPIPSGVIGRTDQGVDISASPGASIVDPVPGVSKAVGTIRNWYQGQPFQWFKVLTGKFAGKYWYQAEQTNPTLASGQEVSQGQQVGTYAASGTGHSEWANTRSSHQRLYGRSSDTRRRQFCVTRQGWQSNGYSYVTWQHAVICARRVP